MSHEKQNPIIQVRDLTVRFDEHLVFENISFDVYEGEIFVILGPSGCGKTTLLRHMIGLMTPEKGSILIDGEDITRMDEEERDHLSRRFGVLFQSGALFKSMTLGENVAMPLREATRLSDELVAELVRMKLAMVNLHGHENMMPAQMSGGMQKRGGMARALALDPKLLFVDEPSAGLDPVTSVELDDLILALNHSLGTTMIVVTHELQSIFKIAQRAIMLDTVTHGIIAMGTPGEMRESDIPRVRAFFRRERVQDTAP